MAVAADRSSGTSAAWRTACDAHDADALFVLLQVGQDIESLSNEEISSGFVLGCREGQVDVVRSLLALDHRGIGHADRDGVGRGEGGIWQAMLSGSMGMVRALFPGHPASGARALGARALEHGFRVACGGGHLDVVCELLDLAGDREVDVHAANVEGPEAGFRNACRQGHVHVVRELLSLSGAREVNMHMGDREGPEAGFRLACARGHVDVVRELLALGGDRTVDVHAESWHGRENGFWMACHNGHAGVVRALLALEGDRAVDVHVNIGDGPEACFRCACHYGHQRVVCELLALTGDREVDVHAADEDGPDAGFRKACSRGAYAVVRELLGLTGHRAIPLQARLAGGDIAVRAAKDAVWSGTSTRRGRAAMVAFRRAVRGSPKLSH